MSSLLVLGWPQRPGCKRLFVQTLLKGVVSIRIFYCSRSSRSKSDIAYFNNNYLLERPQYNVFLVKSHLTTGVSVTSCVSGVASLESLLQTAAVWLLVLDESSRVMGSEKKKKKSVKTVLMSVVFPCFQKSIES